MSYIYVPMKYFSVACIFSARIICLSMAQNFSVDFRTESTLPSYIVAGGQYALVDVALANIDGETVLAVDNSGITSAWGPMFDITELSNNISSAPYLSFHYKPAVAKNTGGVINFKIGITINGIAAVWNNDTQTGALNVDLKADESGWVYAVIDLQPLLDHWQLQTGDTSPMIVEAVQLQPGATDVVDQQYRDTIYFRGFHLGFTLAAMELDSGENLLINGGFLDGLNSWLFTERAPAQGSVAVVSGELHADVVVDDGTNWHLGLSQSGISLQSNTNYRLSFTARAESSRNLALQLKSRSLGGLFWKNFQLHDSSESFVAEFTHSSADITDVTIHFFLGSEGVNDVWLDNITLSKVATGSNTSWIPQGRPFAILPELDGTVMFSKWYQPVVNPDVTELSSLAVTSITAVAGMTNIIDTGTMESGTYNLTLTKNGVVEAFQEVHLAFTTPPLSQDYEVSVVQGGSTNELTVYYSYGRDEYIQYDWNLQPIATRVYSDRGMTAHSWAGCSLDSPIQVRVKVRNGAEGISLPLQSAKILPSSYDIPCSIEGGDTIVFTLNRPEKVAVIANYDEAMAIYETRAVGHVPVQSWTNDYQQELARETYEGARLKRDLSEGFTNPMVFLGHPPDENVPTLESSDVLIVEPGDQPTQDELDTFDTIWFAAGAHDFSRMGNAPYYQTMIRAGQTFYLDDGAYLLARIKKNQVLGSAACTIRGRGVVSGIHHHWTGDYDNGSQIIDVDRVSGITVVDRAKFGIEGGELIEGIAMLGAWHGNNDGLDSLDHCTVENSFLIAHDDNLKLNDHTLARHLVIWQLKSAHPIMVKEMLDGVVFSNSVVEDVDIIAYFSEPTTWEHPWGKLGPGAIACLTGSDLQVRNFTFRDIRIESPYLFRVFSLYNMDTNEDYAPNWFTPTSEERHTRIDGLIFENITVDSPLIAYRSLLGSAYTDSFSNVSFANLDVNNVRVGEENKDDFFEIETDKLWNLTFHESLYSSWSNQYTLSESLEGDDDGDGVANLTEFVLGGDPNDPSDIGIQPEVIVESGGLSYLHAMLAKRNLGVTYRVETTDNLISNNWTTLNNPIVGTNELGSDFMMISNWIPFTDETLQFIRLRFEVE